MESDRSRRLGCLQTVCGQKLDKSLFYLTFYTHRHNDKSPASSCPRIPLGLKRKWIKLTLPCAH